MRTPLFLLFTMVLSARNACYGMAPGVEAAARWSHVPINAEVHSMPERLGLPAGRRLLDTDDVGSFAAGQGGQPAAGPGGVPGYGSLAMV